VAGSKVEILATHHVWFPERKCFTLRMSSAIADAKLERLHRDWQTVFDAEPCAPVKATGVRFAGTGAGGRMVRMSPDEVLLTVGDHEFDGTKYTPAQDSASSFGKTILVNTATREARRFTAGHRNPQGLLRARDGRIWSTEHGPKGGDELNVLRDGGNYGWPLATYGAQYGEYAWPLAPSSAQERAFERPMYAWVPSIGISQLIQVEGRKFTPWAGDLLVSSLRASSLFRVRVDGDRIAFAEQIRLDVGRIRDLAEHPDGTIALLSEGRLILLRPAEAAAAATTAAAVAPPSSLLGALVDTTRGLLQDLVKSRRN
jgi:glucose/arabinose dehydrogenase